MTKELRVKIGKAVREAARRKRLSVAMKASWARRKASLNNAPVASETSLDYLYQATRILVDLDQLRTDVANEFSVDELIGGLITYTGGGTSVQKNLRKFLITQIETSLA